MLFSNNLRPTLMGLGIAFALNTVSSSALAARPNQGTSTCFSNKELNQLAKTYLIELQTIDSNVSLTDVKTVMNTAGTCASIEDLNAAITQFSIELANAAPVISGSPQASIIEGSFYIFTPTASDAEGQNLTFSVSNLPGWAYFDVNTGTVLGIPMHADLGTYPDIMISVTDGIETSSLGLSIEVTNAPAAAQSPLLGNIASYSVHLGTAVDDLNTVMHLDVNNTGEVQANNTLSSANTYYLAVIARDQDGNILSLPENEIAGFRIYIGNSPDDMNPLYNFTDGSQKIYWVNNLLSGTYYVSITTFDVNGNETPLSNLAQFNMI